MIRHFILVHIAIFGFSSATNASTVFSATLNSDQEVPPGGATNSTATGTASLFLNEAQDALTYEFRILGIDFTQVVNGTPVDEITGDDSATLLHIHNGDFGMNGPVVFGQFNPAHDLDDLTAEFDDSTMEWVISGIWEETDDNGNALLSTQLTDLFNDGLYINLHTVGDPAGAIRGQIGVVPEPSTFLLGGLGAVGVLLMVRLRSRRSNQLSRTHSNASLVS